MSNRWRDLPADWDKIQWFPSRSDDKDGPRYDVTTRRGVQIATCETEAIMERIINLHEAARAAGPIALPKVDRDHLRFARSQVNGVGATRGPDPGLERWFRQKCDAVCAVLDRLIGTDD
jgi:hypothetical protein